jgi:uncharacterized protein YehS (DUF1456 family)
VTQKFKDFSMTNNDVLRKLRFIFNIADADMLDMFSLGGEDAGTDQLEDWIKTEDDVDYVHCPNTKLEIFLNGFIVFRRGKKDGPKAILERKISNNIILRKLKIALDFKNEDILNVLTLADHPSNERELIAMLRKKGNKHYRACNEEFLFNFLEGLQLKYHKA